MLEDLEAIRKLQWNYAYAFDYGELDEVLDYFLDDAIMEVGVRAGLEKGPLGGRYEGKGAIKELFGSIIPEKDRFSAAHLTVNPVVTVDGDRAKGRFYCLLPSGAERAMWGHGTYDMKYVKVGGDWKISHFRFLWAFYTPYEDGWGKIPMTEA